MVEILVVLAILAGTAALIAAYLPAQIRQPTVKQTALMLSAYLRRARIEAVTTQKEVNFVMDMGHHRFWIEGVSATRTQLPANTHIDAVTAKSKAREGQVWFAFFPDGTSSGGNINLESSNQNATIAIDWMTGMAHVEADEGTESTR